MLQINNITKTYGSQGNEMHALNNVSLNVEKGEIFGVIGLSGAGKSTLLKAIAGLITADSGEIIVDGVNPTLLKGNASRQFKKNVGVVFQGYNLLMQKNVYDNIAFPLSINKVSKADIEVRVNELLSWVGLESKAKSYPSQLSGGQKQRVAIARALASNPKILLLDEVTSALDPMTTKQILALLKEINQKSGVTMLLITHEMGVISKICEKVVVLNYGKIVEMGNSKDILQNPKSDVTKMLLGKEDENND